MNTQEARKVRMAEAASGQTMLEFCGVATVLFLLMFGLMSLGAAVYSYNTVSNATREAARAMPTAALDYGDPRGSATLREVVAGYLRRVRSAAADPERRVLEDALCLVFLEHQLAELAAKTSDEKVITALRKSWQKMTPAAQAEALKLSYGPKERALLEQALRKS